jgi:hypothetical protein
MLTEDSENFNYAFEELAGFLSHVEKKVECRSIPGVRGQPERDSELHRIDC